jgi:hypothetical protein
LSIYGLPPGPEPFAQQPLAGATVQLYELDDPAIAGDDVAIPATGASDKFTHKTEIEDVKTYHPLPDQLLGTELTDANGLVKFIATANAFGGILTDIRTTADIHTGEVIASTTSNRKIVERRPDYGLTITNANGSVIAERMVIALNAPENKRLGTADNPFAVHIMNTPLVDGT